MAQVRYFNPTCETHNIGGVVIPSGGVRMVDESDVNTALASNILAPGDAVPAFTANCNENSATNGNGDLSAVIAESEDVVPAGESRKINGRLWLNGTTADITVPANTDDASLEAEGLEKHVWHVSHASDSQVLGGVVNADALLANMADGQAFHFQAGSQITLDSANIIVTSVNGTINPVPAPVAIEPNVQGYMTKDGSGQVSVVYTTQENKSFASVNETVKIEETADAIDLSVDACAINQYIHNIKDFYIAISHEGDGGTNMTITVNGVPAVYEDLLNATDAGNGQVNFNSGANSSWNRRARVAGKVLTKVGDTVVISGVNTQDFDGQFVSFSTKPDSLAHAATDQYRLGFSRGAGAASGFHRFLDNTNNELASGQFASGEFEITRTLAGFKVKRNDVEFYQTPVDCKDLTEKTSFVAEGVEIDAFPAYTVSQTIAVSGTPSTDVNTGVDLNEVDTLKFSLLRSNQQHIVSEINLNDFIYDSDTGGLLHWWDNTGLRVRINTADKSTGLIKVSSLSSELAIQRIEFKKSVKGTSTRIGEFVHRSTNTFSDDADAEAKGFLAVKAGTVTNGATTYPIWASYYPEFVSGNDIVFPADVEGMFLRNLNGNAAAEGVFQDSANKAHTHSYTDTSHPNFRPQGTGSNVVRQGSTNTTKNTASHGEVEARPVNRAYQLYTIVDNYVNATAGESLTATVNEVGILNVIATQDNTTIQPAGNGLFKFDESKTIHQLDSIATFDSATGQVTVAEYPESDLKVTAFFQTVSSTGAATRPYHLRDISTATNVVLGDAGIFGVDSQQTPATAIIPAGTAITFDVRSASSGANQRMAKGSFIKIEAVDRSAFVEVDLTGVVDGDPVRFISDGAGGFKIGK